MVYVYNLDPTPRFRFFSFVNSCWFIRSDCKVPPQLLFLVGRDLTVRSKRRQVYLARQYPLQQAVGNQKIRTTGRVGVAGPWQKGFEFYLQFYPTRGTYQIVQYSHPKYILGGMKMIQNSRKKMSWVCKKKVYLSVKNDDFWSQVTV